MLAISGIAFISAGVYAQAAQNITPGQYEYTTKTEVFGMSIPVTFKQCVTQKDIDTNSAYVNQKGMDGCTPAELKRSGEKITIKYTCAKPKSTAEGSGTVSADAYSMDMKVVQHDQKLVVNTKLSAKRLGECK